MSGLSKTSVVQVDEVLEYRPSYIAVPLKIDIPIGARISCGREDRVESATELWYLPDLPRLNRKEEFPGGLATHPST